MKGNIEYIKRTQERLSSILSTSSSLLKVAKMLTAEKYVKPFRKGYRFEVKKWINEQLARAVPLELPSKVTQLENVVLPTGAGEVVTKGKGGAFVAPFIKYPRVFLAIEVISELGYNYQLIDGLVDSRSLRTESYVAIFIPERKQVILVCDLEGNASFVFHADIVSESMVIDLLQFSKSIIKTWGKVISQLDWINNVALWQASLKYLLQFEESPFTVPTSWMRASSLAKQLRVDISTIMGRVNRYKTSRPGWFRNLEANRIAAVQVHPQFAKMVITELSQRLPPPPGWKNANQVTNERVIAKDHKRLYRLLAPYRETNPEWFGEFLGRDNRLQEHYSPELLELLIQQQQARVWAPESWILLGSLIAETEISHNALSSAILNRFGEDGIKMYPLTKGCRDAYFVSPEAVKYVRDHLTSRKNILSDWQTLTEIATELRTTSHTLKKLMEEVVLLKSEFKQYIMSNGEKIIYYAPSYIEKLKPFVDKQHESISKTFQAKREQGWLISKEVAQVVNFSWRGVSTLFGYLLAKNLVGESDVFDNAKYRLFSPLSIDQMKIFLENGFAKNSKPGERWKTFSEFLVGKNGNRDDWTALFREIHKLHPDWALVAPDPVSIIWLSPAAQRYLVTTTYARTVIPNASMEATPQGFVSFVEFFELAGGARQKWLEILKPYRIINPEWFKVAITESQKKAEFISCDLVTKLKETDYFKKLNERHQHELIPSDWVSVCQFAKHYDLQRNTIKRRLYGLMGSNPFMVKYGRKNGRLGLSFHPNFVDTFLQHLKAKGDYK